MKPKGCICGIYFVCGVLLFLLPFYIGLLSPQSVTVPVTVVCAAATLAAAEEWYYIYTGKEIT